MTPSTGSLRTDDNISHLLRLLTCVEGPSVVGGCHELEPLLPCARRHSCSEICALFQYPNRCPRGTVRGIALFVVQVLRGVLMNNVTSKPQNSIILHLPQRTPAIGHVNAEGSELRGHRGNFSRQRLEYRLQRFEPTGRRTHDTVFIQGGPGLSRHIPRRATVNQILKTGSRREFASRRFARGCRYSDGERALFSDSRLVQPCRRSIAVSSLSDRPAGARQFAKEGAAPGPA